MVGELLQVEHIFWIINAALLMESRAAKLEDLVTLSFFACITILLYILYSTSFEQLGDIGDTFLYLCFSWFRIGSFSNLTNLCM